MLDLVSHSPMWKIFFDDDNLLSKYFQPDQDRQFPPVDIVQDEEAKYFYIDMAIAGFSKENIEVSVDRQYLIVKGKKKSNLNSNEVFIKKTLNTLEFSRVWSFETSYWDYKNPTVTFNDGILRIRIERNPKIESEIKNIKIG